MTEYRDAEHFLRVHHDEGDLAIEVFHPESCMHRLVDAQYESGAQEYDCAIARHIREWSYDLHLKDVPDGTYLAQYWATPPGWAGPVAIDAEDGIELNQLTLLEEVTELQTIIEQAAHDQCGCLGGGCRIP